MKMNPFFLACGLLIVLLLGSCSEETTGPQAWIDTPQNHSVFPLQPLTIMAHASSSNGITGMEFLVEGQTIHTVETGGNRMESAQVEWTPPGTGVYLIGARGIDASGSPGAVAVSRITVSMEFTGTVDLTITPTVSRTLTVTPTTSKTITKTPTLTASVTVTPVTPPAGQPQPPPPSEPQPPPVEVQPPAPVDTTPPTLLYPQASPDIVLTEGGGCASYSRTVTVVAAVADDGGIGSVTAYWSIAAGESGQAAMSMGGLGYYTTIGPFHSVGPMSIYIVARDTAGLTTTSPTLSVTVNECIE